ncbi:hypothetical protein MMC10_010193 [Thelotrema lepadinum]|nr:hypothetical protein [Thelotrema lepadinum]
MEVPEDDAGARARVREVRRLLLEEKGEGEGGYLRYIEGAMGEVYAGVVRRCLAGGRSLGIEEGADESGREVGVKMLEAFDTLVVKALGGIRV